MNNTLQFYDVTILVSRRYVDGSLEDSRQVVIGRGIDDESAGIDALDKLVSGLEFNGRDCIVTCKLEKAIGYDGKSSRVYSCTNNLFSRTVSKPDL